MPIYETVYILRQDLNESQVKEISDNFHKILETDDGKILKTENWGLRTLAYKIEKNRRGYYVLVESETAPAALHEMERQMRLDENVLRSMTIRLDEATNGPSVVMDKSGRDDDTPARSKKEAA
jgi:small subunit ribosomal protein S6